MSKAVVIHALGGPEVLTYEDHEVGRPGPGELRVRNGAIGINFIDVYQRTGTYKLALPFVAGSEGAGEVVEIGPGVTEFKVGDHVGYTGPVGAYAEKRLLPAARAVRLPPGISDEVAAAVLLKGGTAQYLLFDTYAVQAGQTILVHAAAGGVGSILTQWATALGVRVLAAAGSDEKVAMAKASGAEFAFNYGTPDWVKAVREATDGKGVDAVYDGVGKATFEGSLDCLKPRGMMVSYGSASGAVSIANLGIL
ncbi:MAG TPA: quinone oxidoreductase, partial [Devosia sp.]|nr:quinone oxidoreductase [Devosia sp.]